MDKVLVVIVTYNAMQWAERCFSSIFSSSIPLDVYVVDNGSTDGSQNYIKSCYPNIHFYQSEINLGFGRANNIGMQYALDNNYDYVYLLNQDAWVMPDTVEKLIDIHKENPGYGILSPFQLQANMQHLDANFASWVCSWEANKFLLDDLYFCNRKTIYSVPMVMAAHWLISKSCLHKVGGFSPTFPHYGEDVNYANRAKYHAFKVGIVPEVIAIHDREGREINSQKEMYLIYISNLILLSNIADEVSHKIVRIFWRSLGTVLLFRSLSPLRYMLKIILNYNRIKRNKVYSKGHSAFLNLYERRNSYCHSLL